MIAIGEEKCLTPAKLAELIRGLRERHEWSQAALAASAGLSERTIQRVENAEGSNRQTRRSLAKAFGFEDRDIFEKPIPIEKTPIPKPTPFSNIESSVQAASDFLQIRPEVKESLEESGARVSAAEDDFYATMNAFMVELEKYTELIQITPIRNGRTLRTMLEQSTFYWVVEEFGDHIPAAREAFAKLENYLDNYLEIGRAKIEALCTRGKLDDYLKDPRNIAHEYSTTERIRIDADLDALLARILEQHCVVGAGFKRYSFHTQDRDPLLRIHFVLAPDAAFPVKIRVPRAVPIQIRRPAVTSKDGGTDRGSKS